MSNAKHIVSDAVSGVSFACLDGETLLESSIRSGTMAIKVGCRAGGCGMCKVQIVNGRYRTGKMSRAHVTEDEEALGFVLACRTHPEDGLEIRSAQITIHGSSSGIGSG